MNATQILRFSKRYTFAFGKGYLSTFLSSLSMAGLVLAISLLIIVLSVMNGFDKEMRERILGLVPHITVYSQQAIANWQVEAAIIERHPEVTNVAPFTQFDALFIRGRDIETASTIGVDFINQPPPEQLTDSISADQLTAFTQDKEGLLLGSALALKLGLSPGDRVSLIIPSKGSSRADMAARSQTLTLRGVVVTGTEMDQSAAIVHIGLASQLAGLNGGVTGLRVSTKDIFGVTQVAWELVQQLPPGHYASNWTMTHGNLYAAIQLSRDLVTILLFSIIGVAAFNVVSSLVLVVFDKQSDIAILRTLGASPFNIAAIFILQGAMIGLVGVVLGSTLGIVGSLAIPKIVAGLEHIFEFKFLSTDVYPVAFLPVDIVPGDVAAVGLVAFVMCVVAAIYPALRGARLKPATVLHQD
ncbi:MAG: lipoprotein-releasing system permease protein [Halioglobus sp.]